MALETSEEICEALVRHMEVSGADVFEKNFLQAGRISCTVWCMIGPHAAAFNEMVKRWLDENGFEEDEFLSPGKEQQNR